MFLAAVKWYWELQNYGAIVVIAKELYEIY
jgi:hypothetical protein